MSNDKQNLQKIKHIINSISFLNIYIASIRIYYHPFKSFKQNYQTCHNIILFTNIFLHTYYNLHSFNYLLIAHIIDQSSKVGKLAHAALILYCVTVPFTTFYLELDYTHFIIEVLNFICYVPSLTNIYKYNIYCTTVYCKVFFFKYLSNENSKIFMICSFIHIHTHRYIFHFICYIFF